MELRFINGKLLCQPLKVLFIHLNLQPAFGASLKLLTEQRYIKRNAFEDIFRSYLG